MTNNDIWIQIANERTAQRLEAQVTGRVLLGLPRRRISIRGMISQIGHMLIEVGFRLESTDPDNTAAHHHHVHVRRPRLAAKHS